MLIETWTEDRVERLKVLWADGRSASQIARELGDPVTRNSVIGKVSRLGLPGRTPLTQARRYRSGPVSHAEKLRRAHERATLNAILKAERAAKRIEAASIQLVELPPPAEFLGLTFAELKRRDCRYPRGEGANVRFCGQRAKEISSYCSHCHSICHYQPRERHPLPYIQQEERRTRVLTEASGSVVSHDGAPVRFGAA